MPHESDDWLISEQLRLSIRETVRVTIAELGFDARADQAKLDQVRDLEKRVDALEELLSFLQRGVLLAAVVIVGALGAVLLKQAGAF